MKQSHFLRLVHLALVLVLAGCDNGQPYQKDWPRIDRGWLPWLGNGCPDLNGRYDNTDINLLSLLSHDVPPQRAFYQTHQAEIVMSPDRSELTLHFSLNEAGLCHFKDYQLRYNKDFGDFANDVHLVRGQDYHCSSKWLYPTQPLEGNNRLRKIGFTRENKGGLVAKIVSEEDVTLSINAAAPTWHLGTHNVTSWEHWPARNPAKDAKLSALEDVVILQHKHIATSERTPTRTTSFVMEPVCVEIARRDLPLAKTLDCDQPRQHKLRFSATHREFMDRHASYRMRWWRLSKPESAITINIVPDQLDDIETLDKNPLPAVCP